MGCQLATCQCTKLKEKIYCKNWIPTGVYKYCDYYFQHRQPCPITEEKTKPCATCQYFDKSEKAGRPNQSGIDWSDPDQVNEHRRKIRECRKNTQSNKS